MEKNQKISTLTWIRARRLQLSGTKIRSSNLRLEVVHRLVKRFRFKTKKKEAKNLQFQKHPPLCKLKPRCSQEILIEFLRAALPQKDLKVQLQSHQRFLKMILLLNQLTSSNLMATRNPKSNSNNSRLSRRRTIFRSSLPLNHQRR